MLKIRLFTIDKYKKEEKWLNKLCKKGWAFTSLSKGVFYRFERCEPGQYQYALAYRPEGKEYPEAGGEEVFRYNGWIYFRRPARQGDYEVYSDKRDILALAQETAKRSARTTLLPYSLVCVSSACLLNGESPVHIVVMALIIFRMLFSVSNLYSLRLFIKKLKLEIE